MRCLVQQKFKTMYGDSNFEFYLDEFSNYEWFLSCKKDNSDNWVYIKADA